MAKVKNSGSSVVTSSTTASRRLRFPFRKKKQVNKGGEKASYIHEEAQDGVDQTRGHHSLDIMGSKGNKEQVPNIISTVAAETIFAEQTTPRTSGNSKSARVGKKDGKDVTKALGGTSFFTRSMRFQNMVDNIFVSIDTDNSGEVDKKELYAGLILIHLRLAAYVGPAACRPATKEYVEEIFELLDVDDSGELNREEFGTVMALLVSQITTRVLLYLIFPLIIIPFAAELFIDFFSGIERDERITSFKNAAQNIIIPDGMKDFFSAARMKIDEIVPDDLMEKLPLALMTTLLGLIALPWAVIQIDGFLNKIAASKKKGKKSS